MHQMLLRVPDDLHSRLAERARRSGRSINALANEILDQGVADESGDARAALRAKAHRLGVLASKSAPSVPERARDQAIASTRGIGAVLDDLLTDGR